MKALIMFHTSQYFPNISSLFSQDQSAYDTAILRDPKVMLKLLPTLVRPPCCNWWFTKWEKIKIKRLGDLQWLTGRARLRKYESSDYKILICGTQRHTCTVSTVTSKASLYSFSGRKVASWLKKERNKQTKSKKYTE
jgi:hypothetical protein